ncbi:outer membrane beta-barrel protein [Pedobacter fastidiosus]|uniref:TonB-dependent receptor n=1 Tax=Pedobacter fastidiosus TaxID=2765361 RepID=A0ABR7KWC6_9SPHI|nr:outer membrane beta-barrel protein [Pedobacter fastidiosus]MBC6112414.1 TonB-dependent receptor [Pedobacter fastidiosus]
MKSLKFIAPLLLVFATSIAFAQTKTSVKGIIADFDSKAPLEFATVAIVNAKDTTLISYTLTDKNGAFKLAGIAIDKPTKIIVSYVGYTTHRQILNLKKDVIEDFKTIYLQGNHLDEVVIKGERSPVVIKKDTIEFNTEAFKTRPNAVVEELLKKLPGVQVNVDGSILVNGKSISKLLIDGKEFFGTDPKVATKNLDADMVDKIQVYDDRENDPDHLVSETQVSKIINLKLKSKIKKSTLGKIYGGAGSRDRYEVGGILSNFRDTLQVSVIGLANNLNKTGFSQNELYSMGGFDRSGGQQAWDGTFGGRGWGGIESVSSAGLNINNNYGTKLKLNLTYFLTHTGNLNIGNSIQEQSVANTILTSVSSNNSNNRNNKHAIGGLIELVPDTMRRLRYEPKLNLRYDNNANETLGSSANTQNPKLTESNGANSNKSSNSGFSHNFSFYKRLKKKGESFTINHSLQLNDNEGFNFSRYNILSYTADIKSEMQNRFRDSWNKSSSGDLSLTYNYPFTKKLFAEFNTYTKYSINKDHAGTFENNPLTGNYDILLINLSNDLQRNVFTQNFRPQLLYKINKNYSVRLGVKAEYQDVKNKFNYGYADIDQDFYNFFPTFRLDGPSMSLSYDERLDLPNISQMQPIVRTYNSLYTSVGNPDLKPSHVRNINLNIYKYSYAKQINFNAYSGLNFSDNVVIQRSLVNSAGATNASFVNRDGNFNGYAGIGFGKQFKKSQNWQVSFNHNMSINMGHRPFILNENDGFANTLNIYTDENINFNYKELLSLSMRYSFNRESTNYKNVDFNTVNTYTHTLGSDLSLRWPKRIILDANYSYNYNPQVSEGFPKSAHQLNLALTFQMLKKDRGQLKLSVYDIFDQNISVSRYAYNNAVITSDRNILRRYFLATYQYKINIFKK